MIRLKFLAFTILTSTLLAAATLIAGNVKADPFDDQIQALRAQNSANQAQANSLAEVAASYQAAVDALGARISSLQSAIVATQAQIDSLQKQIVQAQADLDREKQVLGENIKTMYLEGDVSTLEILASSNNLSDFVNKQEYRNSVSSKVKASVEKINLLKAELQTQQRQQEGLLKDQQTQQNQLVADQNQQNQMLSYTESQKAVYDSQIKANNSQIASLRAQQLAANRRFLGSRGISLSAGDPNRGGYPANLANAPKDALTDPWGMFNRECVSYTAWKVFQTFGYMPYWGGVGNANQWPGNAIRDNIPTGTTPKVNSVAIGMDPNYFGYYGHSMWVEEVYANGYILVSQYNFGQPGQYSEMTINGAGLTYIYFGS